jgi:hypothetical protein
MPINVIDRFSGVQVNDVGTLAPTLSTGQPDPSKKDILEVRVNGALVGASAAHRKVTLASGNGDAAVTHVSLELAVKGNAAVILPAMNTAARDAIPNPIPGMLIFNSQTNKLNVRGASAWEAVTST